MSVAAAGSRAGESRLEPRTRVDRLLAALPLATVFAWLLFLYAWESWGHGSPWLFVDELKFTQLARGIADTGHAARRGQPAFFTTLYTYLTAPGWLFHDTHTAYTAVKYISVATMTSVVFPAYFLARLVVSPRAALFAAAATAAVPAIAYSSILIEEPLAYPYATLCLFLITKGLATRSPRWLVAAGAAALPAPVVRGQLAVLPAVYVLAALFTAWTSEPARRWRTRWSLGDWVGALVLGAGALIFLSAVIGGHSYSWLVATGYYRHRMLTLGLWAAGALTIGLGVLPVVAGVTALFRPAGERRTPAERAFTSVFVASVIGFGFYTAVKAAYLSTVFATRVEERNLIYLSPLLLVATALWLDRPRVRLPALAATAAFVAYLIASTPYQLDSRFYSDAPGLAILSSASRLLALTASDVTWAMSGILAVSVLVLLAPRLLGARRRIVQAVLAFAATLVLAWNVTGEIAAAIGSNNFSSSLLSTLPKPVNWLDQETGGAPALYLGQKIIDPNSVWLLEFWNRSLRYVWSLDGTAPGPGPNLTPDLVGRAGALYPAPPHLRYVVADHGVALVGKVLSIHGSWRLYRVDPPLRLETAVTGIFADGWAGADSGYSRYATPGNRPGFAIVSVSRAAWGGTDVPGEVQIRVGTLVIGDDHQPRLGRATAIRTWTVHSHAQRVFWIPTPRPPFRVEVAITPTFQPAALDPRSGDRRNLGAQVGFVFTEHRPIPRKHTRLG